jgi:hypothetical protein
VCSSTVLRAQLRAEAPRAASDVVKAHRALLRASRAAAQRCAALLRSTA